MSMKSTVDAKAFADALGKVSKCLTRSDMPILEEACVTFTGDRCMITATNLEQWLTAEIPACGDSFSFLLSRSKNASKLCGFYDGELSLERSDRFTAGKEELYRLIMRCGQRASEHTVIDAEDFPEKPPFVAEESYTVNADQLLKRVNRVKYAVCSVDRRPDFSGVRFLDTRIVCVDGYRLAVDTNDTLCVQTPFIVPSKSLEYLKLFGDAEITMLPSKSYIQFNGNGFSIHSRLLEDRGFKLDDVIPKTFCEEYSLSPKAFLRELNYLERCAAPKGKQVIRFDSGRLTMTAQANQHTGYIEVVGRSKIPFGFDPDYMIDAMKQFADADRVTLHVGSPLSPIVVTAGVRSDMAMVLPVRLKEKAAA